MIRYICAIVCVALLGVMASSAVFGAEAKARLSWSPPTERVDGTPMGVEEIGSFRLYYAVDAPVEPDSDTTEMVELQPFQTAHGVTLDLAPREEAYTVSFAITTVDTDGLEAPLSEVVSKTFKLDSTAAPGQVMDLTVTVSCGEGCEITVTE